MSTVSSDNAQGQVQGPSVLRGVLLGMLPLLLLALIVLVTLVVSALARQWLAGSGFFAEQQVDLVVFIVGFILALLAFAVALWRVANEIKAWQQAGLLQPARAALCALGITALIVVLPIVLAIVVPQRPAP